MFWKRFIFNNKFIGVRISNTPHPPVPKFYNLGEFFRKRILAEALNLQFMNPLNLYVQL